MYEKLRDILEREMEEMASRDLTGHSLECIYKMIDIVKDSYEIETMRDKLRM